MKYYTIYKDDEIVAFGTSSQCTKMLGLKDLRQFYAFVSKARSGLRKHFAIVAEEIADEQPDDDTVL